MQVSLETTSGLERRLTVGVPAEVIDKEVNKRLLDAAKSVRINGFRKGKVPLKVVRQKFGAGVRQEVLGEAMNRSFYDAVVQNDLKPAGQPSIVPKQYSEGKDLQFIATFEVYPEIDLKGIEGVNIDRLEAEITDSDVNEMIETLRKSQASWVVVARAAQNGDRVNIDFVGTKGNEVFDGGSSKGHMLELGSNTMIPGFEAGIVGTVAGDTKVLSLTFPADYHADSLKGAAVEFSVTVNSVSEQQLPELNDQFFASFGVNDGGLEKFRVDVKDNMAREKDRVIKTKLKTQVLDALLEKNPVEVPKALVLNEINALREQALQQYGQLDTSKLDIRSLLPDNIFRERAERRTTLGLLVTEVITKQSLKVDKDRLKELIENVASTYEDPASVVSYYYGNKELLAGAEAAVLEDQVVDFLLASADVTAKKVTYQELIKPESNS